MPLTDDGFVPLDEATELENQRQMLRDAFEDQNMDLPEHSPFGQLAIKQTKDRLECDASLEDVYDSGLIPSAQGVSLDRLGSNYGVSRTNATPAMAKLKITGTAGYIVPATTTEFLTDDGTTFINAYDTQIDEDGTAELTVYSEDMANYVNVAANTITVQGNPVAEIDTVTNPEPAVSGADLEADYDFRRRMMINSNSMENGTETGLKVAMLNVAGVTDADVKTNRTDTVDEYGNPSHTIHVYVMGGSPADIAQKLYDVAGGETAWVGDTVTNAYDSGGRAHEVRFDVEQEIGVKLKLDLQTSSTIDEDAVKQSVLDYFETRKMGDPVVLNQLYGYLYQITGVDLVKSIQAGTGDTLGTDDITVTAYQLATTDDDSIEVTINVG
jgi:uncharacterized phage protein gp47/JayE